MISTEGKHTIERIVLVREVMIQLNQSKQDICFYKNNFIVPYLSL